jgi:hypothetical protein
MKKHILVAGAAVLALGFSVSVASAYTCTSPTNIPPGAYPHPYTAKKVVASLTQAFVSCGAPNATTETGTVPTCDPAESYHQAAGSPTGGWLWGPRSRGAITFRASKNKIVNLLNPPGDSVDLLISVKINGIEDENGASDGGNGSVATVARATIIDRLADHLMTVIDFPTGFGVTTSHGSIKKRTSATAILNGLSQPALPPCANVEVVSVLVKDPNGNSFANIGTFLNAP